MKRARFWSVLVVAGVLPTFGATPPHRVTIGQPILIEQRIGNQGHDWLQLLVSIQITGEANVIANHENAEVALPHELFLAPNASDTVRYRLTAADDYRACVRAEVFASREVREQCVDVDVLTDTAPHWTHEVQSLTVEAP